MSGDHNMNLYGDGTVFRGERSADSEVPTIDWQSTREMWKAAHEALDALHEIHWSNDSHWQSERAAPLIDLLKERLK